MKYFFTGDEHYNHANIIEYCNRPFKNVAEMDAMLIKNHNEVVGPKDVVIHVGDFTLIKDFNRASAYIARLNGEHEMLQGSHDRWVRMRDIFEKQIGDNYIVACHYAMRVWPRSHYGSYQFYGHSHGKLAPVGRQWDVGVDNNNYYPVSLDELIKKLKHLKNFNQIN